jgi:hypothetical protein
MNLYGVGVTVLPRFHAVLDYVSGSFEPAQSWTERGLQGASTRHPELCRIYLTTVVNTKSRRLQGGRKSEVRIGKVNLAY